MIIARNCLASSAGGAAIASTNCVSVRVSKKRGNHTSIIRELLGVIALRLENQRPPAAGVPITPLLDLLRAHVRSVAFRLRATGTTVRAAASAAATISGEVFGARTRVASRVVRIATLFDYLVRNLLVGKRKTLAERNRWKCDQRANRKECGPPHDRTLSAVVSNVASVPPVVPGDSGIVLRPTAVAVTATARDADYPPRPFRRLVQEAARYI